ncbi:PrgI family protein [Patescibacteria group bacterium]
MQYEVPQFIEVEDKIIGPFTIRQFLTMVVGAVALAILYFMLPMIAFIIMGIPVVVFVGALGFLKINGRPFYFFLAHLTGYIYHPRLRVWRRDPTLPAVKAKQSDKETLEAQERKTKKLPRTGIERLSYILDHASTESSVYTEVAEEKIRRGEVE